MINGVYKNNKQLLIYYFYDRINDNLPRLT